MTRLSIMLGALLILLSSSVVLVVAPYFAYVWPEAQGRNHELSEVQQRGREVYISMGCVYCHSQQPRNPGYGPDTARGWGYQPSAQDYAGQYPHQLGTSRTGPDLYNIGDRNPSIQWNLIHLYDPRLVVPWSIMPSFRFLFTEKDQPGPEDVVLDLKNIGVHPPRHVVATQDALALMAYLKSLQQKELPAHE
ncbi:MAG: cbb3-type cytochrome c oxidase subunit II [Zetaproteobacteria bacterium]|nr:cbb3-type cytochrome c oxidase subunit II [Zetaproteobacteria bacterium]